MRHNAEDFLNKPFASRRGFQFTLVTLFILTLSVAGTLAGYRIGFRQGYVRGELKRKSEIPFSKVFGVADLVKQNNGDTSAAIPGDYLSLLGIIERTIAAARKAFAKV